MKTKLTLTISDHIVRRARHQSRKSGKSLSRMFEELFESKEKSPMKTESQRAAERLLLLIEQSKPIKTLNDKELLKKHIARKYA